MDNILYIFQGESSCLQSIVKWVYTLTKERALLLMYMHIIVAALFPIFAGSHASLRCPPSAKVPKKTKKLNIEEDDDELDDCSPEIQGLQPSDAILFPVMAGIILGGLYLLIKWLDDPKILSKILNWYFSGIGVFGVGKLTVDTLNVIVTFVFPRVWSTKREIYYIDDIKSCQPMDSSVKSEANSISIKTVKDVLNPLPGLISTIPFPACFSSIIWRARASFKNHLVFRGYIKNLMRIAVPIRLTHIIGYTFGLIVIIFYNVLSRPWWLTNTIAFGFCYSTLQLMSPTTFWTGTLVLSGLFIYDITMVFYTPLMVTVASSLDIPIKLVFPGPKKGSMLGLGDVVLPGIMIALALRFDLYLHYLRKQRAATSVSESDKTTLIKPDYIEATGAWGEKFWTSNFEQRSSCKTVADGARFKKIYFWASMTGYVVGLVVTLFVLKIFNHAQPALLYLVPGVLLPLWGTAWARGEIKTMYDYTEDGEKEQNSKENKSSDESTSDLYDNNGIKKNESAQANEKNGVKTAEFVTATDKMKGHERDINHNRILYFSLNIPKGQY
ncbi:putative intramembrane protease [Erysiphe neolycopersici]|uniref:Putative intramembrane protease n=1 Tax=Erysiphe neolycopersici TaxID=212602 RepID=A0A420HTH9_9PEZI|nr:putative intramembrane protease [Erysiphe neolycopersici]